MGTAIHREHGDRSITAAVLTVTTSRTLATDKTGELIRRELEKEGHRVVDHRLAPDHIFAITSALRDILTTHAPRVVLVNGGTGISPTDVTIEAVRPLLDKEMPAFSALFAHLSFEEVDTAALLSRAMAGTLDSSLIFCLPGSSRACKLALAQLILPELSHMAAHAAGKV
ncbi:MAG: MogA/MoaB family molybdenum cofactor biosynthesis protein [Proteobacteria bacterium]|nr:MogA/MoaB family molybdenum cofactor biosynthesis protein [Pseudomonadota bacterium]